MKAAGTTFGCRRKILKTLLAVLAGSLICLPVFSSPVLGWLELDRKLSEKKAELLAMEEALHRREQLEKIAQKFEQRILATGTDSQELGLLLQELESLTRQHDVRVRSIRPLPSQWLGNYRKFTALLDVEGRVHNVVKLLYAVETSQKVLTVEALKLQAQRTDSAELSAMIAVSRTSAGIKQ